MSKLNFSVSSAFPLGKWFLKLIVALPWTITYLESWFFEIVGISILMYWLLRFSIEPNNKVRNNDVNL